MLKNDMNILILNWRDPKHPLAGGAEQMVLEHAKYWKKEGAKITWFASSFRNAKHKEVIDGIEIIRKGNHYTVFIWAFIFYLQRKFLEVNLVVDCFHFIPYFSHFYMRRIPKIAIIQEVAGKLWYENLPFPLAFVGSILEPYILRAHKSIPFITGSESARNDLIKLGLSKKKIHVINHGINRYKVKKIEKEKNPVIIFLGRVSKDKGIEDALMVLGLLKRDYQEITLWVVGKSESKSYEIKVKKLAKQYEVSKNYKWFGYVTDEEKYRLLSKAWILIHPSVKEGWGLNVIEANSVGTPAVGYAVGGLKDSIVNNKTGLLVESDVLSLADGVERLVTEKSLYGRLSKNAIEWSDNFRWEKSAAQSYEIISGIIK